MGLRRWFGLFSKIFGSAYISVVFIYWPPQKISPWAIISVLSGYFLLRRSSDRCLVCHRGLDLGDELRLRLIDGPISGMNVPPTRGPKIHPFLLAKEMVLSRGNIK